LRGLGLDLAAEDLVTDSPDLLANVEFASVKAARRAARAAASVPCLYQKLARVRGARPGNAWIAEKAHAAAADDTFVYDCEQGISVQNEAWMVKWTDASAAEGI